MYLISVEGGDGSGKGEAVRLLGEIAKEFPFPNIHVTHEPRRHSKLGKLALESVQKGDKTPLQEAGLFAADRLDHSHTWIIPILENGSLVISDRNIHSSLIYQGYVGDLGLDRVAKMNSAAAIPDLVLWIDCDPEKAMKRIQSGTLRMANAKQEYFETTEIQKKIRRGFSELLGKELDTPKPFDKCTVVGPILNEGGLDDLKKSLRKALRTFFNQRPEPLNVDSDKVDQHLIESLLRDMKKQQRLPGAPGEFNPIHQGWLDGKTPSSWLSMAEKSWPASSAKKADVPANPLARSAWSVIGTLSLMSGSCEIPRLHNSFGPIRTVTQRHTQRLVRWLISEDWIFKQQNHVPFSEGQMFKLRDQKLGYGRLCIAMWPIRRELSSWRKANKEKSWDSAIEDIFLVGKEKPLSSKLNLAFENITNRLHILSSGHVDCPIPSSPEELSIWWKTKPAK